MNGRRYPFVKKGMTLDMAADQEIARINSRVSDWSSGILCRNQRKVLSAINDWLSAMIFHHCDNPYGDLTEGPHHVRVSMPSKEFISKMVQNLIDKQIKEVLRNQDINSAEKDILCAMMATKEFKAVLRESFLDRFFPPREDLDDDDDDDSENEEEDEEYKF